MTVSRVRWNGADRPTTFISDTQLRAEITAADLATTGTASVTVFTPAPGGGVSNALTISIQANPAPTITSVNPPSLPMGTPGVSLVANGSGFSPASKVRWNGMDRPTTYIRSDQVRATIPASDLTAPDVAEVRVLNPGPGGGASPAQRVPIYLSLTAKDLIYDKTRQRLYASVSGGAQANTIAVIDPLTGATGPSIPIGNNPGKLAMSDNGQYLYVALDVNAGLKIPKSAD